MWKKFEELEVLMEPRVDLNNLANNEFDFRENFVHMGWMEYFSIEKKPIYKEFVKEFWIGAKIVNGNIYGCVQGREVLISQKLLEQVTNCYAEGVKLSDEWNEEEIKEELEGIIFENSNGKSYSDLNPEYKVLYKIISGCILPLGNSFEKVTRIYRFIMWHFAKKLSMNLPWLMLDFLKRCIWFSKSRKVQTIPLGRVISSCLETLGIINILRRSNNFNIVQSFGPVLNHKTLEELKVRSCDLIEKLLKKDNEVEKREVVRKRKKNNDVASTSTNRVTKKKRTLEHTPPVNKSSIMSVIFPEDNKEVVLEYRKIIAEEFFRDNPNYTPHVQYEDYDEDNKDEVRKYMKKVEEEKAHENIASSSGILKEPLESDHHVASSSSDLAVGKEEVAKIIQQQQKIIAFMEATNQRHEDLTNAINNLTSLVQKILDKP